MSRATRSSAAQKALSDAQKLTPLAPSTAIPAVILPTLLFENASAWESWLESHLDNAIGIWMQISKKGATKPSVSYEEALDIALCYGWIDGQTKSLDDEYFLRKFTPRRKNSMWSKRNIGKVAALVKAERIRPSGQAEIDAAKADGRWERAYASPSNIQVPEDFQKALAKNKEAKTFFGALNKSQRYSFLWRIETTKRAETRQRKIAQFIDLLKNHKTV